MNEKALSYVALTAIAAAWGLTLPLTKIALSSGYLHFGLLFWQLALMSMVLMAIVFFRGGLFRPNRHQALLILVVAVMGSVFPNTFSYQAAAELPAGVMAVIISLVPMFAFPIAIAIGAERFTARRFLGVLMGLFAVILLIAPQSSLPHPSLWMFVLLGIIAPFCYAIEGNFVAQFGLQKLDPLQTLLGASLLGTIMIAPVAIGTNQWIEIPDNWTGPEKALVAMSLLHVVAYSGYVWLVNRAGSVFAAQVSYLVTGFGVVWSMLILSETYSSFVWLALLLMLWGVSLVQPKRKRPN